MRLTRIILASGSAFRKKLLEDCGVTFEVVVPAVDEQSITTDLATELAAARARAKCIEVSARAPEALVIGADQVLGFAGKSLDKVDDLDAARQRLTLMAGKRHSLHAAFCLAGKGRVISEHVCSVEMQMRPLSVVEIETYLATNEWQGSVGCYRFEQAGIQLFERVDASYCDQSLIVGLPLLPLFSSLRAMGVNLLDVPKGPWDVSAND